MKFTEFCESRRLVGLPNGYVINKKNRDCVKSAFEVLTAREKGVMLVGKCGAGKTLFFDLFREWIWQEHRAVVYAMLDCENVANRFTPDDGWTFNSLVRFYATLSRVTVFDDLVQEDTINDFGNKREVMRSIIRLRAKRPEYLTHFTTNFSLAQIAARYGEDVTSRISGTCKIIEFNSPYGDMRAVV